MIRATLLLPALLLLLAGAAVAQTTPTFGETQVGTTCKNKAHSTDFDTLVQCTSTDATDGTLQKAPLFVGEVTSPPYPNTTCDVNKAGMIQYTASGGMQYCNGSAWTGFASGSSAASTMIEGWPDAIVCNVSGSQNVFYATHLPYSGNGRYYYRQLDTTTYVSLIFAPDGSFYGYQNVASSNCNKSISQLYADGQAFDFVGGGADSSSVGGTIGEIITWTASTPPTGFLECNGAAVSRTTYADLFAVIGTTYGTGDGSTTFNLPDLRGEFLRGWDHGRGADPDAASRTGGDAVGSTQGGEIQSHLHRENPTGQRSSAGTIVGWYKGAGSGVPEVDINTYPTGGNETRPRNVNVMFAIRYALTSGSGGTVVGGGETGTTSSFLGATATETSPSVSGDLTTGLFSPAASTVAISTGGTEALRVTATGSVGIGTTSPTAPLTVGTKTGGGSVTIGASDDSAEGAQINMTGAGSNDNWSIDVNGNDLRFFTNSAKTNTVKIFNNGTGVANLQVEGSITSSGGVPTGAVFAWPVSTVPSGYLECNGAAVSRTTYAALFSVIGTTYGAGNGSTTFNLPDYRGEFLRGWAHGDAADPDRASRTNRGDGTTGDNVGTKQTDGLKSHTHAIPNNNNISVGTGQNILNYLYTQAGNTTSGAFGGNETRPRNVNVMYIIKY